MKNIYLLWVFIMIFQFKINAQNNFTQIQNPYLHNVGSSILPSLLGNNMKGGEIFIMNPFIGISNNLFSVQDIKQLVASENITNQYIEQLLTQMPNQGRLWIGLDIPILNTFFKIRKKRKEFLNFGFGMNERFDLDLTINKDLFSLAYKGNKQFADKTISLSPSMNMLLYSEYFIAASGQINLFGNDTTHRTIAIKPAIRLRYLNGMASVYMPQSEIEMFTASDGRYIDFKSNMAINMSSAVDTPDFQKNFDNTDLKNFKSSGHGLGIDIGVGAELIPNLFVHVAVTDIGSIKFNKNTVNYTKNETYRYDGIDLNQEGKNINGPELENLLQPQKSYNHYKQPLPTRFILSGLYGIGKKIKKNIPYYTHNLSATYLQGFKNYLSTSKTPIINLGYSYNLANMLDAGINLTFGGLSKFQSGAQLGFRVLGMKLGVASNNLVPLISQKTARGADVYVYLGCYF